MCAQYSNEYNTIRAHLEALSILKTMQQPTSEAMRQIIDISRGSYRQLQLMLKPEQIAKTYWIWKAVCSGTSAEALMIYRH